MVTALVAWLILYALGWIAWARRLHVRAGWELYPAILFGCMWPIIFPFLWAITRGPEN